MQWPKPAKYANSSVRYPLRIPQTSHNHNQPLGPAILVLESALVDHGVTNEVRVFENVQTLLKSKVTFPRQRSLLCELVDNRQME